MMILGLFAGAFVVWMVAVVSLLMGIERASERTRELTQLIADGLACERDEARRRRVHDEAKKAARGW
jgi:hypothetical protein